VAEPRRSAAAVDAAFTEIRRRMIGRAMRAFSLLYRRDIGGSLRDTLVFRVDGPGGGEWYVGLSLKLPLRAKVPSNIPGW